MEAVASRPHPLPSGRETTPLDGDASPLVRPYLLAYEEHCRQAAFALGVAA